MSFLSRTPFDSNRLSRRSRLALAAVLAVGLVLLIHHGSTTSLNRPMRAAVLARVLEHPGPSHVFAGTGNEIFLPAQVGHRDLTLVLGCLGAGSATFSVGLFQVAAKCAAAPNADGPVTSETFPGVSDGRYAVRIRAGSGARWWVAGLDPL